MDITLKTTPTRYKLTDEYILIGYHFINGAGEYTKYVDGSALERLYCWIEDIKGYKFQIIIRVSYNIYASRSEGGVYDIKEIRFDLTESPNQITSDILISIAKLLKTNNTSFFSYIKSNWDTQIFNFEKELIPKFV